MKECFFEFLRSYLPPAIPELLGGLIALLCAIMGAKIASMGNIEQSRQTALRDAYADLFAQIVESMREVSDGSDLSNQSFSRLVVAGTRTILICSGEAQKIIGKILQEAGSDQCDWAKVGSLVGDLMLEAHRDLKNPRKHKKAKPARQKS